MFSYTVAMQAENKAFMETCALIETNFKEIKKEKLLVDVDGSCYQTYHTPNGKIDVSNDFDIDAVYVDSETNLDHLITSLV